MQTLETRVSADKPIIVLLGRDTTLTTTLARALQKKDLECVLLSTAQLLTHQDILKQAYKIIWVQEKPNFLHKNPYEAIQKELEYIAAQTQYHSKLSVLLPVFNGLLEPINPVFSTWQQEYALQTAHIERVLYHLPTISFFCVENLVTEQLSGTIFRYLLFFHGNAVVTSTQTTITALLEKDAVSALEELLFIPSRQVSYLIQSAPIGANTLISSFQKAYETQKNTELELRTVVATLSSSLPFSAQEKITESNPVTVITQLITTASLELQHKKSQQKTEYTNTVISPPIQSNQPTVVVESIRVEQPAQVVQQLTQKPAQNIQIEEEVVEKTTTKLFVKPVSKPVIEEKLEKNTEEQLTQDLRQIFKQERVEEKVVHVTKTTHQTQKVVKKSKNRTTLFYLGLFSVFISSCAVVLGLLFFTSQFLLRQQLLAVFAGERIAVNPTIISMVKVQTKIYNSVFDSSLLLTVDMQADLAEHMYTTPESVDKARQLSENLVLQILMGSFEETSEIAQNAMNEGLKAYEKLSQTQALIQQIEFNIDSLEETTILSEYEDAIQELRSRISTAQQIQEIIPTMSGVSSKKTYALLLQNDQELRPTGGFIQAVALLNFDRGSLVSYQVYSVYELDQKIAGDIEPPLEIATYLGESKWYLRDSNWNPDFPATSKQVAWFLDKALNISVDGVLGITTHGLAQILEATGPIDIASHNETLTHKNIAERFEFNSEVILVQTADKQDYPTTVLTHVLKQLTQLEREQALPVANALYESLGQKYLQVSVFNQSEQQVLQSLGWTGSLVVPSCPARLSTNTCIVDVFASVEANVGVNKANYYIERDSTHTVSLSPTAANHRRTISLTNTATSNSWPKGTYRLYQRYFLHTDAQLTSITINEKLLPTQEIVQGKTSDFTSVGFLTQVPVGETVTIELEYSTPLVEASTDFSYVFYNQRQSGITQEPLQVRFTYVPELTPTLIAPNAVVNQKSIEFSSKNTNEASLFSVQFE